MLIVNAVVFDGREFQKGLHLRLEGGVIEETGSARRRYDRRQAVL